MPLDGRLPRFSLQQVLIGVAAICFVLTVFCNRRFLGVSPVFSYVGYSSLAATLAFLLLVSDRVQREYFLFGAAIGSLPALGFFCLAARFSKFGAVFIAIFVLVQASTIIGSIGLVREENNWGWLGLAIGVASLAVWFVETQKAY